VGCAAGIPLLVVPQPDDPRLTFVVHVALVGLFAIGLAFHLAPLSDDPWFGATDLAYVGRRAASWLITTAAVVACAATVGAATAVALRYDPSMQYFVVVAADTVAFPAALAVLGARRRFGAGAAAFAALIVGAVVVSSVWHYVHVVGVGRGGSWVVDGSRFGTLVVPWVAGALAAALFLFTAGTRRP
jgi:hypothetical protein